MISGLTLVTLSVDGREPIAASTFSESRGRLVLDEYALILHLSDAFTGRKTGFIVGRRRLLCRSGRRGGC